MAKNQIQGLNNHVVHLNRVLHQAGVNSHMYRVRLNKAHEHRKELQAKFNRSEAARIQLEKELLEKRQEHRLCQKSFIQEQARGIHLERSLECIWNSHNKLGEIMSRVQCEMDSNAQSTSRMRYNITDLVLELSAKAQRIQKLESTLEQTRSQHKAKVLQLEQKLQIESTQHIENSRDQKQRAYHQYLPLREEHTKTSAEEHGVEVRTEVDGKKKTLSRQEQGPQEQSSRASGQQSE